MKGEVNEESSKGRNERGKEEMNEKGRNERGKEEVNEERKK